MPALDNIVTASDDALWELGVRLEQSPKEVLREIGGQALVGALVMAIPFEVGLSALHHMDRLVWYDVLGMFAVLRQQGGGEDSPERYFAAICVARAANATKFITGWTPEPVLSS